MVTKFMDAAIKTAGSVFGGVVGAIGAIWLMDKIVEVSDAEKREKEEPKVADPEEDDIKIENIDVD